MDADARRRARRASAEQLLRDLFPLDEPHPSEADIATVVQAIDYAVAQAVGERDEELATERGNDRAFQSENAQIYNDLVHNDLALDLKDGHGRTAMTMLAEARARVRVALEACLEALRREPLAEPIMSAEQAVAEVVLEGAPAAEIQRVVEAAGQPYIERRPER